MRQRGPPRSAPCNSLGAVDISKRNKSERSKIASYQSMSVWWQIPPCLLEESLLKWFAYAIISNFAQQASGLISIKERSGDTSRKPPLTTTQFGSLGCEFLGAHSYRSSSSPIVNKASTPAPSIIVITGANRSV